MKPTERAKQALAYKLVDYLCDDPENNMANIMGKIDALAPASLFAEQRAAFSDAIKNKTNMYQLIMRVMDLNPEVRADLLKTFVMDANFLAWGRQEKMRERHQCNIPWAILLDPTSACNLHCTGCWAAEYGHALNLAYDEIDSIIRQGKELGVHVYIYTGGEPLVRKRDLIRLCEAHPDCAFLCFTNSTLIDEEFCQEMIRVKNFVPAISAEGDEAATDGRRGAGTYAKVDAAMDLLASHGLPFGVSICYTHDNAHSVASDAYFDWLTDKGALFAWIFTYMPVGKGAPTELMPTPDDRKLLYHFNRRVRAEKPILTLDFQHDGEFVGGCIAGGRRYLHINAAGDVEPCVFIHYSNANIREQPLLECLKSPLFHGLLRGAALQRQLAAALSDARESRPPGGDGREERRPRHRPRRNGKRPRSGREMPPGGPGMGARGRAPVDERRRQARTLPSTPVLRHGRNRQGEVCAARPHHARGLRSGPPRGRDGTGAGAGR